MANFNIDYLIVAGGGGGGAGYTASTVGTGGGGGAGGYLTNVGSTSLSLNTSTSYTITIGSGGSGGAPSVNSSSGSDSIFSGTGITTIQATGGGRGGMYNNSNIGGSGGSGGGTGYSGGFAAGGSGNTPSTTPSQGNDGGDYYEASPYGGSGGGGAGSVGSDGPTNVDGGSGVANSITGTSTFYAAGGGGGKPGTSGTQAGGSGIGGNGGNASSLNGTNGVANTGSGGGGAGHPFATGNNSGSAGDGGSGIVILRYATADANYTATGLTPTETTDGTDTILSFTTVGTGTITFSTPPPPPFNPTKVTTPVTDFNKLNTEEGLKIPSGTSSNQPTGVEGMVRNDTTQSSAGSSSAITYYNGTNWRYFENELNTSFNTVLYTGNGATQSITGVGFEPDLVWIKQRTGSVANHLLFDSIRGAYKQIMPNTTSSTVDRTSADKGLTSFDSNGFTVKDTNAGDYEINGPNGGTYSGNGSYVAWCFKAGGLINKAAEFNGSSSKITLPTGSPFNDSDTIKAVSVWVKADTSTSRVYPLSISSTSDSNDFWYIGYMGDLNAIYVATRDGSSSNQSIAYATITPDTGWHHIVVQLTATGKEIYLDGVNQTITNSNSGTATNTSWISYPSYSGTVQGAIGVLRLASISYSQGKIDQVRIFNNALSSSQITQLYNETKADNSVLNFPSGAGCVAAYPLGENANGVDGLYNGTASNVTFDKPGYLTRNTEGTIESNVSVNNDLKFSIVSYTGNGTAGSTVGHGLDSTPEMVIVKSLTTTANQSWSVYQVDVGNNGSLTLELPNTPYYDIGYWNNTSPTSSVFTLGYYAVSNQNNANYIAYCFASKPNYSKVGSYLGNGNATGPTVTLGFEPAFVMIKGVNQSGDWTMLDNKRDTSNPNSARLDANSNMAEYNAVGLMDFNSDGFQIVTTQAAQNALNKTFIYLAFANTI